MMLAMRLERNVLEEHDLVIAADLLEGPGKVDRGVLFIAAGILLPCSSDALWRVGQPFAVGVVAGPADQRADRVGDLARNRDVGVGRDQVAIVWPVHESSSSAISAAIPAACAR